MPPFAETGALSGTYRERRRYCHGSGEDRGRPALANAHETERSQSVSGAMYLLPEIRARVRTRGSTFTCPNEGRTGGHLGVRRTSAQVQRRAYWPNWRRDVELYLKRCTPCARYLRGKPGRQGLLQNMVVGEVGEVLALDLTGPHVVSSQGNKFVLTMVDHFSGYAEAFPVRNQEASTVARVLVDNWISRYGCPLQILTDQGPCFEAALFKDLCRLLGVTKIRTSAYKASTNGLLERFHRTLNSMLAKFISETQKNWDQQLPLIMSAYRASQHSSTGYTPNRLFLNREVCMPLDLVLGECIERNEPTSSYHEYVHEKGAQIQATFSIARDCMRRRAEIRAYKYDLRVKPKEFPVNSFVWYFYPRKRAGLKEKWLKFYTGPYKVEQRVGPVLYQIRKSPRAKAQLVYVDKLKPYVGDLPESWGGMAPTAGGGETTAMDIPGDAAEDVSEVDSEEAAIEWYAEPLEPRPKRHARPPNRYGFED